MGVLSSKSQTRGEPTVHNESIQQAHLTACSLNHTMPQRDTVAGVAWLRSETSNRMRMFGDRERRSPLGNVSILLSSNTLQRSSVRPRQRAVKRKHRPVQVFGPLRVDVTVEDDPVVAALLAALIVDDLRTDAVVRSRPTNRRCRPCAR
jgi:hypothetical protein